MASEDMKTTESVGGGGFDGVNLAEEAKLNQMCLGACKSLPLPQPYMQTFQKEPVKLVVVTL